MGIGIDLVDIKRVENIVNSSLGEKFINKVFTEQERDEWLARGKRISLLAGRFAAKEAFIKAIGETGIRWKDIEVLGKIPQIKFKQDNCKAELSISHTNELAVSVVVHHGVAIR